MSRQPFAYGIVTACAWCEREPDETPGVRISHTICPACEAEYFPDEKDPATEATATGPERSEATRASAPTDYKVGGPRG